MRESVKNRTESNNMMMLRIIHINSKFNSLTSTELDSSRKINAWRFKIDEKWEGVYSDKDDILTDFDFSSQFDSSVSLANKQISHYINWRLFDSITDIAPALNDTRFTQNVFKIFFNDNRKTTFDKHRWSVVCANTFEIQYRLNIEIISSNLATSKYPYQRVSPPKPF